MARWLLPEGISDVLPHEAWRLEQLRRTLLDLYRGYGYALVMPPLLEYLESLLTGVGADLDLRTFKLVDQLSGRMLGLRADTTPQVARIDAHILNRPGVVRLCYAGSVVHARPAHPLAVREPLQVGAELYGFEGPAADREVQSLAVVSLRAAGLTSIRLDFGHTRIVRSLLSHVPPAALEAVTAALAVKDMSSIARIAQELPAPINEQLQVLVRLHGGAEVLTAARRCFKGIEAIASALDELESLAASCGADDVSFDLAELHGYGYYTGVNFAAYAPGVASALLRGGRYDDIGKAFGRRRPATGFSVDLRDVASTFALAGEAAAELIVAPADRDVALDALVERLRSEGRVVVRRLDNAAVDPQPATHQIERTNAGWQVVPVSQRR